MAKVLTLDDVNVDGKTVLLRVDINSPLDPSTKAFLDDTRIRAILPTLQKLVKAKVILLAHQSRPGKDDFTSTLVTPVNLVAFSAVRSSGWTTFTAPKP